MNGTVPILRSLITAMTPPVLLHPAQKLWRRTRGIGFYTFEGCWPTLSAVPCGTDTYDDAEIARQTAPYLECLRIAGSTATSADDGRTILPLIVAEICDGEPFTVVDFGGGPCVGLSYIADHVPTLDLAKFSYVLVETPATCRAVRAKIAPILVGRFGSGEFFTATSDIPSAVNGRVIVNISSAIQYIDDYQFALEQLAALAPDFFIVSLTPFTESLTYACRQRNIPHKKIATWVFNRAEFIARMEKLGYRPAFSVDHDMPVTHRDTPAPRWHGSIVFAPRANHTSGSRGL